MPDDVPRGRGPTMTEQDTSPLATGARHGDAQETDETTSPLEPHPGDRPRPSAPPSPIGHIEPPPTPRGLGPLVPPAARAPITSSPPPLRPVPPPVTHFGSTRPAHAVRRLDARLELLTEPDSARSASFRLMRDNLVAKRMPRVIAVSSPMPGDGKTTCAANLALALAELVPTRVLLVEGNFFEPGLASLLAIDASSPVSPVNASWLTPYRIVEVMRGLDAAVMVLDPGEPPPRYDRQWFETLVSSLRRVDYDYLIIDAPALGVSPTVGQLVALADATLLAVRAGKTTARALRRAASQIPQGRAIGVALVDASPNG